MAKAINGALRVRLVEWDADSAAWPCDPLAAAKVVLKAVASAGGGGGGGGYTMNERGVMYRAYLQPNELQDLADGLSDIMDLRAKHGIKIRFNLAVEATVEKDLKPEATVDLPKALDDI